jgi:hypothetical protein
MTRETNTRPRRRARGRRFGAPAAAACALALALPQSTGAQEAGAAPPRLTLDVFAGVVREDTDPGETETRAVSILGMGYATSTGSQELTFAADVTAELGEDGFALTDPSLALSYDIFNRQTRVGIDVLYSSGDVDAAELDDDFDAGDLLAATGTREDIDVALTLETGRDARFGSTTVLTWGETTFADGAADSDETTFGIASTLRFTLDPRIELRLTRAWDRREIDDLGGTEETTARVGLEADLAIDRLWSATTGIGYATTEAESGGVTTSSADGVEAFLIVTREMRAGALSFSFGRELFDEGLRDTVEIGRTLALSDGGALSASLGFTVFREDDDIAPIATLSYAQRLTRRSSVVIDFDYVGDIDDAGDRIQRTSLSGAFRQNLTENSSWGLDAGLASVESEAAATADVLSTDLGLSYIHALTNDWNVVARASYEVTYEDGDVEERSNVFSLGVERTFSVRP